MRQVLCVSASFVCSHASTLCWHCVSCGADSLSERVCLYEGCAEAAVSGVPLHGCMVHSGDGLRVCYSGSIFAEGVLIHFVSAHQQVGAAGVVVATSHHMLHSSTSVK